MSSKPSTLLVDIDLVEEPLHMLRQVDEDDPEFQNLVRSMQGDGFWPSKPLEVTQEGDYYVLTDGLHRWSAARKAGLKEVWVVVYPGKLEEHDRLERSLIHNATVVATRPVDYARAVVKLLEFHKDWTIPDAAKRLRQSVSWVQSRLKVAKLEGEAAELTNSGRIPLETAQALVKLQEAGGDVGEWLERATELPAADVAPGVLSAAKTLKGQKKADEDLWRLRPLGDVRQELLRAREQNDAPCYLKALEWVCRKTQDTLFECPTPDECPCPLPDASD